LPRIASDVDGSYQGFAQDTLIHKADGFDYYDDFSMWDTYRALHPLMTILEPKRTLDMVKSLVLKAQQGGWMPIFPAWGSYTAAMIGDHVSTMISDAYMKGITGFDAETAYKYMRQNAFDSPPEKDYKDGKGRRALKVICNMDIFLLKTAYGMLFTGMNRYPERLNMLSTIMLSLDLQRL